MHQPLGIHDPIHPDYVCLLQKSLYVLKQAPRAWCQWFADFVTTIGFHDRISDNSLFVYSYVSDIAYLLLYFVDIVLTTLSDSLRQSIMSKLSSEFAMKDLRPLSYFLDIVVSNTSTGLFLSQCKYVVEILEKARISNCKPAPTPVATTKKLRIDSGSPYDNPTLYRSLAGALQYLTFTRPDISYAVQQVCLFMHDPRVEHMAALYIFFAMSKVLLIMVYNSTSPLSHLFYLIWVLIGVVVLILAARHLDTVSFWVII